MKILVPTDFSDNANQAIEYAVEICNATKGRLTVLHVLGDRSYALQDHLSAEESLEALIAAIIAEYPDLDCRSKMSAGEVVDQILEEADELGANLIVMGTQGASNLGRLFFGSNTAAVIERAGCTVLSVPSDHPFKKPQKMLFSTNFSREEMKAAVDFVHLAKLFGATVVIAHVSVRQEREEVETSMIEIFTNDVIRQTNYKNVIWKVASENTISMGLDALINETGADLIALSTRRRNIFEKMYNPSVTRKFSLQADIPLLAFHAETVQA